MMINIFANICRIKLWVLFKTIINYARFIFKNDFYLFSSKKDEITNWSFWSLLVIFFYTLTDCNLHMPVIYLFFCTNWKLKLWVQTDIRLKTFNSTQNENQSLNISHNKEYVLKRKYVLFQIQSII